MNLRVFLKMKFIRRFIKNTFVKCEILYDDFRKILNVRSYLIVSQDKCCMTSSTSRLKMDTVLPKSYFIQTTKNIKNPKSNKNM